MLITGILTFVLCITGISDVYAGDAIQLGEFDRDVVLASSFLEEEAGISAYCQVSSVDLDLAKNAYKNIEYETNDYIIGSVVVDGYPESHDVHVYVDISGWIVAYYSSGVRTGKIIDWHEYMGGEITKTKLSEVIEKVALEMLVIPGPISYYHFGYPDATHMMIITDEVINKCATETFIITVPGAYSLYNRTWAHAIRDTKYGGVASNIKIDDDVLNDVNYDGSWYYKFGDITPTQIFPNIPHTISLYCKGYYCDGGSAYVAIVLLYSE
jgi:hypothetical protein